MKRYLIFSSPVYYPAHAEQQVIGSVDNLNEVDVVLNDKENYFNDYYSILDLQDRVWVVKGDYMPKRKAMIV